MYPFILFPSIGCIMFIAWRLLVALKLPYWLWYGIWDTGAYKNGLKLLYITNGAETGFQPTGGYITGLV